MDFHEDFERPKNDVFVRILILPESFVQVFSYKHAETNAIQKPSFALRTKKNFETKIFEKFVGDVFVF